MLKIKSQIDVVCSAIGIKEAITMCPISAWICEGIKRNSGINIGLSLEQCVAIGKVLGELGFVNEMGENPLDLIQKMESEKETSDRPEIEV